jgi:hypothetical protein
MLTVGRGAHGIGYPVNYLPAFFRRPLKVILVCVWVSGFQRIYTFDRPVGSHST